MAMFNSYATNYQRVSTGAGPGFGEDEFLEHHIWGYPVFDQTYLYRYIVCVCIYIYNVHKKIHTNTRYTPLCLTQMFIEFTCFLFFWQQQIAYFPCTMSPYLCVGTEVSLYLITKPFWEQRWLIEKINAHLGWVRPQIHRSYPLVNVQKANWKITVLNR